MSKGTEEMNTDRVAAAILTQIYFLHTHDGEAPFLMPAIPSEIYFSERAEKIGRVYACFLRDLPSFEEWARLDSEAEKEQDVAV